MPKLWLFSKLKAKKLLNACDYYNLLIGELSQNAIKIAKMNKMICDLGAESIKWGCANRFFYADRKLRPVQGR